MASKVRYAEIRFNDRPIKDMLTDPESFTLEPGEITADYEARADKRLDQLYPDIAAYRTSATRRFIDPAEKALEEERLWSEAWLLAGVASDLKAVGDWFRFDIARQSIIVVRSKEDEVNAFYNVCKHRGNELVQEEFGHGANSFTCIVHSWRFNLKGRNVRVTDRDTFSAEALCQNLDLTPVHVKVWGGLVFVCLSENPMPFEEYFGEIMPMLASYRMDEMFVVKDLSIEVPANWKTMYTVFNENYHAHATHPQIKPYVDDHFIQYDFYRHGHNRNLFPVAAVSPRWPDGRFINMGLAFFMMEAGIKTTGFKGDARHVRRAIQAAKRRPDNVYGMSFDGFTDNQLTDDWNPSIFPNLALNAFPEAVQVMRFLPHPTDPAKSFFHVWILVPTTKPGVRPPANFGVEDDVDVTGNVRPQRAYTRQDAAGVGDVLQQDIDNMAAVQRGLASAGMADGLRLSEQEQRIQQFHAEIDHRLARAGV